MRFDAPPTQEKEILNSYTELRNTVERVLPADWMDKTKEDWENETLKALWKRSEISKGSRYEQIINYCRLFLIEADKHRYPDNPVFKDLNGHDYSSGKYHVLYDDSDLHDYLYTHVFLEIPVLDEGKVIAIDESELVFDTNFVKPAEPEKEVTHPIPEFTSDNKGKKPPELNLSEIESRASVGNLSKTDVKGLLETESGKANLNLILGTINAYLERKHIREGGFGRYVEVIIKDDLKTDFDKLAHSMYLAATINKFYGKAKYLETPQTGIESLSASIGQDHHVLFESVSESQRVEQPETSDLSSPNEQVGEIILQENVAYTESDFLKVLDLIFEHNEVDVESAENWIKDFFDKLKVNNTGEAVLITNNQNGKSYTIKSMLDLYNNIKNFVEQKRDEVDRIDRVGR
jgi:hypothetical protein